MEISAPDRSIPREILRDILGYEKEAYVQLRVGRYGEAVGLYHRELELIMEWQDRIDRPIHKGAPLHMMGICLILQDETDEALRFFLLAYIEDTLNVGYHSEHEADLSPAGQTLRSAFQINVGFLETTKKYVADLKGKGEWANARDPAKILDAVIERVRPVSLGALCKSKPEVISRKPIDPLPGTWDKRVFIGGDYDHLSILREIQEAVVRAGFHPVLPFDFILPEHLIHHHDLLLLHCCRLGIFEVSTPAGHLMEIERAKDYDVRAVLFYTDRDGQPHSLSSMVLTAGYDMIPYSDISDLKQKVTDWLSRN